MTNLPALRPGGDCEPAWPEAPRPDTDTLPDISQYQETTVTDARARTHVKALAEEIQGFLRASPDDKSEAAVFMAGVVNGLTTAVRILDGATADEAFTALETQIATAVGRFYLNGQIDLTPPTTGESPMTETCLHFSEHGWGRCVEPRNHAPGKHMYRNPKL